MRDLTYSAIYIKSELFSCSSSMNFYVLIYSYFSIVLEALGKGRICFEQKRLFFGKKAFLFKALLGECLCETDRSISKAIDIKPRNKN